MDADKMPLPIVREFHQYVSTIEDEINAGVSVENRMAHRAKRKRSPSGAKRTAKPAGVEARQEEPKAERQEPPSIADMSEEDLSGHIHTLSKKREDLLNNDPLLASLTRKLNETNNSDERSKLQIKVLDRRKQLCEGIDTQINSARKELDRRLNSMTVAELEALIATQEQRVEGVLDKERNTDRADEFIAQRLMLYEKATGLFLSILRKKGEAKAQEYIANGFFAKMTDKELDKAIRQYGAAMKICNTYYNVDYTASDVLQDWLKEKHEKDRYKAWAQNYYVCDAAKAEKEKRKINSLKTDFEKERRGVLAKRKNTVTVAAKTKKDIEAQRDALKNTDPKKWLEVSYNRNELSDCAHMCDLVGEPKRVTDKIGDIEKGEPMTFEQADSGSVNPNYRENAKDGFDSNCQTCNVVFVARMMGFDVEALPNDGSNKVIEKLSQCSSSAFIDKNTGLPPKKTVPNCKTTNELVNWVYKNLKAETLYAISFGWQKEHDGHTVVIQKKTDPSSNLGFRMWIYDSQINKNYTGGRDVESYFKEIKKQTFAIFNVSDCDLNESVCKHIMKKRGE